MWNEGNFQLLPSRLTSCYIYFMTSYLPTILASTSLLFCEGCLQNHFSQCLDVVLPPGETACSCMLTTETQHMVKHSALSRQCSCLVKMSTLERDCVALSPERINFSLTKKKEKKEKAFFFSV